MARTSNLVAILAICAVGTGGGFAVAGEFTAKYGVPYVERPSGSLAGRHLYSADSGPPSGGFGCARGGVAHGTSGAALGRGPKAGSAGIFGGGDQLSAGPAGQIPRPDRRLQGRRTVDAYACGGIEARPRADRRIRLLGGGPSGDAAGDDRLAGWFGGGGRPVRGAQHAAAGGGGRGNAVRFSRDAPRPENAEFLARRDAGGDGGAVSLGLAGVVCDGG